MNAHTPASAAEAVTSQALALAATNADVLRAIAGGDLRTPSEVAHATGRAAKNMSRDMGVLVREVLVLKADGEPYRLSPAGDAALAAIDMAQGRGGSAGHSPAKAAHQDSRDVEADPASDVLLLRHDEIRANPLNPRKTIDDDAIAGLADAIEAADDVLQNLVVFPTDPDGVHTLSAGERRWRAVGLLIEQGRWPADRRLRAIQRENTAGQTSFIALVENGQRQNLALIEEARGYQALVEETGWSAREAALKTGRNPRSVQEMLQVLRDAAPEDVARHEADPRDFTWEALRQTVRDGRGREVGEVQADIEEVAGDAMTSRGVRLQSSEVLAIVEIVARYFDGDRLHPHRTRTIKIDRAYPYGVTGALVRAKLLEMVVEPREGGRQETFVTFTQHATFWLDGRGLWPEGELRDAALDKARAMWGDPWSGQWATYWLNAAEPGEAQPPQASAPPPAAGAGYAALPQPKTDTPLRALKPVERLAMIELAWKLQQDPYAHDAEGVPLVAAPRYWLDATAVDLAGLGLVLFTHTIPGSTLPCAALVQSGRDWIAENYPDGVTVDDLEWTQDQVEGEAGVEGYVTPWLNTPTAATPAAEEAAPEPEPQDQPLPLAAVNDEDLVEGDPAEAQALLTEISHLLDSSQDFDRAAVFRRLGITFPLQAAPDIGVIQDAKGMGLMTVDQEGAFQDAAVTAAVLAIITTLNAAVEQDERPLVAADLPTADKPAVPIRRSITPSEITCLEDGRTFSTGLRAHLRAAYGLTPDAYRLRWDLPRDYPMVAPNAGQARQDAGGRLWSW